ncbi:hypothetical protein D3C86_1578420 [compost metagenome]
MPDHKRCEKKGEDRRRRIENDGETGIDALLRPGNQREGQNAVDTGLNEEQPPRRKIRGQAQPAQPDHHVEQQTGNQRAQCDEGDGRYRLHPDLDESVGCGPQRGQQGEKQQFAGDGVLRGHGSIFLLRSGWRVLTRKQASMLRPRPKFQSFSKKEAPHGVTMRSFGKRDR